MFFPGPGYKLADVKPPIRRPRSRYVRLPRLRPPRDRERWPGPLSASRLGPRQIHRSVCGFVLGLLLLGCRSTFDPASGDPRLDLQHADPRVRIGAAEQAVRQSRSDLCGLLVKNLSDRDGAVRLFSSVALRKLTGEDFDYKAHGTLVERREAIELWTKWLESEGLLARDVGSSEEPPPSSTSSKEASVRDSDGEDSPEPSEALPPGRSAFPDPAPFPDPAVPLNSAAGKLMENAAPREKKSDEKADDRWVGNSSKATRS